jgi:eukaryotic-like serine/threonine-protein kinase
MGVCSLGEGFSLTQPIPFGKYFLLERINVGGMAEVFRAKAVGVEGFERVVAVKRILPSIAEDQDFITMFIDEAKIAVQLTHANIAQIFDLGRVDDSYFIALEYVHGKDLRAIFNRARSRAAPVPIQLACYAIMKVCEGLDYAHNKRDAAGDFLHLVHRDVSPQNILVSYEGEVKIIDFGIAKAAGKAGTTQAGILKGKFGYMSPEQAHGLEIDRQSDVFAVGICLYELLTGERAFLGDTDFATLENVRNVSITPPRVHNPAIPEPLESIVLKALSHDRQQRHATAQQLKQELFGFLRSSGVPFDRRELSAYMHREFADEFARDSARSQEYESSAAADDDDDDEAGLAVFDDIATQQADIEFLARSARRADPKHKITLHGLPGLGETTPTPGPLPAGMTPRPPKPISIPPRSMPPISMPPRVMPPRSLPPRSLPPRLPSAEFLAPEYSGLPTRDARVVTPPQGGTPDLDWDEEELSTQIYDPPEERSGPEVDLQPPTSPQPRMAPPEWLQSATPAATVRSRSGPRSTWGTKTSLALSRARPAHERMLVLVAVAVGTLGIAGFLWFFHAPASGVVQVATTPADATVAVDGRPVSGSSPFVIRGLTTGAAHTIVVEKQGYKLWSSQFEARPEESLRLPDVVLEPVESGFALDSVPSGAHVSVDGQQLDQTTPVRVSALGPGDHRIRVEADGYAPWESSLKVVPGVVLDLPVAQLIARTPEPVRRSDGSQSGVSAGADPGRREVVQRRPVIPRNPPPAVPAKPAPAARPEAAKPPSDRSVAAAPAASAAMGTLRIQTRPWSRVYVDGLAVGTTPLMSLATRAGRHTLTFVNEEFGLRKTVVVQVEAGQVLTQVLNLTE